MPRERAGGSGTWEVLCKRQENLQQGWSAGYPEFPSSEVQRTQLDTVPGKGRSVLIFLNTCSAVLSMLSKKMQQESDKEDTRQGTASLQGWGFGAQECFGLLKRSNSETY